MGGNPWDKMPENFNGKTVLLENETPDDLGERVHRTLTPGTWDDLSDEEKRWNYITYSGDPGKPADVRLHHRTPDGGKWDIKAGDGYEVDPTELRNVASRMETELDGWKSRLNKVVQTKITTDHVGDTAAGARIVQMSKDSTDGYVDYVNQIQGAYTSVIRKLRATAKAYEQAHDDTQQQVDRVNPNGTTA